VNCGTCVDVPRSVLILDVDGTLVDSTYLHTVCWWQAFHQHGFEVPMAEIHRAVGMGADHLVPHLVGTVPDHVRRDLSDEHGRLWHVWWPRVPTTRGAPALLHEAARAGLDVVLASSAKADELDAMRRVLDSDDCITAAVGAGDVDASKPEPDLLAVALDRVGADPADALFVGDSVWDGAAAQRAGITFVGVLCGGTSSAELTGSGARATYEDPGDLAVDLVRWTVGADDATEVVPLRQARS
jgi:phosphoglycolate phosphatase-like HAD superfamily hydrolase